LNKFILIPAFNPGTALNNLIIEIQEISNLPILIVDDGSIPKLKVSNKIYLIRNENNRGKGFALKKGFEWGRSKRFDFAITIDADGQHSPNVINDFIQLDDNIEFGLGYRKFSSGMPIHRKLSNIITSKLISIRISKNILDSQCGYRRYNLNSISNFELKENGFQFESEVIIKSINKNTQIEHILIPTIYAEEKSSINNFKDTIKFIFLYFRSFNW
jgi:glycosyltransferase involved in cell wall biosynthesis